jgi:hypothetical protein
MTPTQWAKNPALRGALQELLATEAFEAAAELILSEQLPANQAGLPVETIATNSQCQAGFFGFLRGLRALATFDEALLAQAMKVQKLNEKPSWSHVSQEDPQDNAD